VSENYQVEEKSLKQTGRGHINNLRNVALYLCRKISDLCLVEIGNGFELDKYSSVSSIVVRIERLLSRHRQLQKRVNILQWMLKDHNKSQAKI